MKLKNVTKTINHFLKSLETNEHLLLLYKDNYFFAAAKTNSVGELKRYLKRENNLLKIQYFQINLLLTSLYKTNNFDVNKRHQLGWTALHVAVVNKNFE